MKNIIITGADGFLGRHFCAAFSSQGWTITALVRPQAKHLDTIRGIPHVTIVTCDHSNLSLIASRLPTAPEAFLHLAWAGVTADQRDDFEIQKTNIDLSVAVLRLAIEVKAQKFILPGSPLEYCLSGKIISGRNDTPTPQNAYAAAKVAARYLCDFLAKQHAMPFIYTIFSSCYGPDRRDKNVIFYVIDSLLHGRTPELTGLEQLWDYVHIDDLARGVIAVCERGKPGKCYPIGHGGSVPLRTYIDTIHELIDPKLPLGIGRIPYPSGKFPCGCIDMTELIEDTGYRPLIPFREGIQSIIEQERKRLREEN